MKTSEIKGKSILILGHGREGKSVEQWLKKNDPTLSVAVTDKTQGTDYLAHLQDFDTVVRSPGVSPYQPEIQDYIIHGGHTTSATNIFFSLVTGTVIGVTGTKGKSTTASLIAHILSLAYPDVRLVGNIGTPMLDHLDGATKKTIFVVELSSHQLVDVRYSPHIAVLLGIVSEHLDYYPDFSAYVSAKSNIVKFQESRDMVVYNPAHREVAPIVQTANGATHPYDPSHANALSTHLLGNAENIMAAVTVARIMHVPEDAIKRQLVSFVSLPHRLEYVGEVGGVAFYNDSLATIPEATIHALDALGEDVSTLIAGGFDRGLSYEVLGKRLAESNVSTLILFPDTGKKILDSISHSKTIAHYFVRSMEDAVEIAAARTPKGKACLLSPASASFNLFRDYADRGDQFKAQVRKIKAT